MRLLIAIGLLLLQEAAHANFKIRKVEMCCDLLDEYFVVDV